MSNSTEHPSLDTLTVLRLSLPHSPCTVTHPLLDPPLVSTLTTQQSLQLVHLLTVEALVLVSTWSMVTTRGFTHSTLLEPLVSMQRTLSSDGTAVFRLLPLLSTLLSRSVPLRTSPGLPQQRKSTQARTPTLPALVTRSTPRRSASLHPQPSMKPTSSASMLHTSKVLHPLLV